MKKLLVLAVAFGIATIAVGCSPTTSTSGGTGTAGSKRM